MSSDETLDGRPDAFPDPDAKTRLQARELRETLLDTEPGVGLTAPDAEGPASDADGTERYRLGPLLGEGGMGRVFAALDNRLRRNVAVKIVHEDRAGPELEARLAEEARIQASLDAPGALPIYDAGQLDGRAFYAMKWVRGSTLSELLRRRSEADVAAAPKRRYFLGLFEQICRVMAAVHGEGVVHRDLKPDNVMVDDYGAVHVMDWGLAKRLDETDSSERPVATIAGQVMGTPGFMSPEQAEGKASSAGPEADVFSLGVILYQILTGQRPFRARSSDGILKATLDGTSRRPRHVVGSIPRALEAICLKALARDPVARYPSALELVDDLRRFQEHRRVGVYRPTVVERLGSWAQRRPGWAASIATFVLLALLIATAWASRRSVEQQRMAEAMTALDEIAAHLAETREHLVELTADPAADPQEKARVAARVEQLEQTLGQVTWGVLGLSVNAGPSEDSKAWREAQSLIRGNLFHDLERFVDDGRLHRALALIESALESAGRENVYGFDETDVERLRTQQIELERSLPPPSR